jgi:hypothetical protein
MHQLGQVVKVRRPDLAVFRQQRLVVIDHVRELHQLGVLCFLVLYYQLECGFIAGQVLVDCIPKFSQHCSQICFVHFSLVLEFPTLVLFFGATFPPFYENAYFNL